MAVTENLALLLGDGGLAARADVGVGYSDFQFFYYGSGGMIEDRELYNVQGGVNIQAGWSESRDFLTERAYVRDADVVFASASWTRNAPAGSGGDTAIRAWTVGLGPGGGTSLIPVDGLFKGGLDFRPQARAAAASIRQRVACE